MLKLVSSLEMIPMQLDQLGAWRDPVPAVASMSREEAFIEQRGESNAEQVVSFQSDVPIGLQDAMKSFIERYPNWDQYRLIQAALAGFLVQNGVESRSITRLYIGNMFSYKSFKSD